MEWLKAEIVRRGVTQKDVGAAAGLTDVQMSKVLSGNRKLSAEEASAIWRHFGYVLPDDEATDTDMRILQHLARLSDDEKTALERLLKRGG
ncbi:helix-turn-helix transcriptional regulator [Paracoccus liaowanqingii]|uniref:Helix-turn-helix transcriptional regulator n=1 Tax=Paracoccus liaowanqingii TaxID=2560053 RepID=A0A4P7HLV0_9RHOB|nr:helix-turn-helix transcriptional regulator [Paracoccus liaowanqingii]QBX34613.1 helix-turn-helix transcriptional regulator [Paracoccus liaowanqingii]